MTNKKRKVTLPEPEKHDIITKYLKQNDKLIQESLDTGILDIDISDFISHGGTSIIDTEKIEKISEYFKYFYETNFPIAELISNNKPLEIRYYNLEETISIDKIGAEYLNKFIETKGTIKAIGEKKTKPDTATFKCKNCMAIHKIKQEDEQLIEPKHCNCGSKYFMYIEEDGTYIDTVKIVLDDNNNDKTKRAEILVEVNGSLIDEIDLNQEVLVTGTLKRMQQTKKEKGTSVRRNLLKANNIKQENNKDIKLTKEDIEEIKEFSKKSNVITELKEMLSPKLVLDDRLKEACLYYVVKGYLPDDKERDEINILIVGDPSTGKSDLGKDTVELSTKYTKTDGSNSTGVGLIGAVVSDPLLNSNTLELGAFPRANGGLCFIDEFDKLAVDEQKKILNAIESGVTDINKAGVHKEVTSKVGVFAVANPKYGRFDDYKTIAEQVKMYSPLLSRFDLIFIMEDKPNKIKDENVARSHLYHTKTVDNKFLKKYLTYANTFKPILTDEGKEYIIHYYTETRHNDTDTNVINYDVRKMLGLERLATARAKLLLKDTANMEDVKRAIEIQQYSHQSIGKDPDTGEIDIDRINGNGSARAKRNRNIMFKTIKELSKNTVSGGVPKEQLRKYLKENENFYNDKFYKTLEELLNHKDIYEKQKTIFINKNNVY